MTAAAPHEPGLALVTGGTSGIGRAFADLLAAEGYDLLLVARNADRLEDTAQEIRRSQPGTQVQVHAGDLSAPDTAGRIFADLAARGQTVEVLINNAGFNVYGPFEDSDADRELEMISLHVVATTQLAKLFLRQRDRTRPNRMLNVASIAAFVPGPFVSVHFATRAHILSFSLALTEEYRGTDVTVTALCPGPTRSAFFGRASMDTVRLASGWPLPLSDPADVARAGYRAMKAGRGIVVPGAMNRFAAICAKFAPRAVAVRFTRWIMSRA